MSGSVRSDHRPPVPAGVSAPCCCRGATAAPWRNRRCSTPCREWRFASGSQWPTFPARAEPSFPPRRGRRQAPFRHRPEVADSRKVSLSYGPLALATRDDPVGPGRLLGPSTPSATQHDFALVVVHRGVFPGRRSAVVFCCATRRRGWYATARAMWIACVTPFPNLAGGTGLIV